MNHSVEFIKDCGVFFLATDDSGQPRVRPFGAIAEIGGRIYITTRPCKDVFRQMIVNPKVEIAAFATDNRWIRLTASVRVTADEVVKAEFLGEYPELSRFSGSGMENSPVILELTDIEETIYS